MGNQANQVELKLDTLIRLLAMNVAKDGNSLGDKAATLNRAGIPPKEIASILGSGAGAIRDALYNAKRPSGKGKSNGKKGKARRRR